jgi:hypothetical protein
VLRHPVCSGFLPLATLLFSAACSLNDPPIITVRNAQLPDAGNTPAAPRVDAGGVGGSGGAGGGGGGPTVPPEVLPSSCTNGDTRPCGPSTEAGECTLGARVCVDGVWGECIGAVYPGTRICGAREDRDCDGLPDDTADAVCECVPGTAEPCETHPGLDNIGTCKAGLRVCEAAADGLSSRWGACTGSVGPAAADDCTVRGDDSNCDAIPNTDCPCIEGEVVECGPSNEGICRKGTSTCVGQKPTECEGAILPEARDCSSEDDNDCDGVPDNEIDDVCTCAVGDVQACGTHPQDNIGVCRAGTRTCVLGDDGSSSAFSPTCVGSVGPGPRRCNAVIDNDCNGKPDNTIDTTCKCEIGVTQSCQTHPQDGVGSCRAGTQLCVAGPDNTTSAFAGCSGSVGPALADSCLAPNDADCDGVANDGCECVVGSNALCADTPATSRCDATANCVPCVADADCALVSGARTQCNAGACVQCVVAADCATGQVCSATFVCQAAPVVEEPVKPPPPAAAAPPAAAKAAAATETEEAE